MAEVAERDVAGELGLVLSRRVQALIDLLAVDSAGRQAVHGDAVTPDVARESLGPRMDGGLGRPGRVGTGRLGRARDVEDASPAPLDHAGQQRLGEPPNRVEVDRHRLVPHGVGRVDGGRPRAAGVVHEDVDVTQSGQGLVAHARGGGAVGEVDGQRVRTRPSRRFDLVLQGLQQFTPPRDDQGRHALGGEHPGDLAPDSHAAPGDHGGAAGKIEIH
jgi:hypothetical protein